MNELVSLQAAAVAHLQSKATLRGVTILPLFRGDIANAIDIAVASLGLCIVVGDGEATNPKPDAAAPRATRRFDVTVIENSVINRNRTLVATVANEAERLALNAGPTPVVTAGQAVAQTDNGLTYWLVAGSGTDAAHWGLVLNIYQLVALVIRSLHGWPSGHGATAVYVGDEFGAPPQEVQGADITANVRFETLVKFDPTEVP